MNHTGTRYYQRKGIVCKSLETTQKASWKTIPHGGGGGGGGSNLSPGGSGSCSVVLGGVSRDTLTPSSASWTHVLLRKQGQRSRMVLSSLGRDWSKPREAAILNLQFPDAQKKKKKTCGRIFTLCTNQVSCDQKCMAPLLPQSPGGPHSEWRMWDVTWQHPGWAASSAQNSHLPDKIHIYLIDDRTENPAEDVQVHVIYRTFS